MSIFDEARKLAEQVKNRVINTAQNAGNYFTPPSAANLKRNAGAIANVANQQIVKPTTQYFTQPARDIYQQSIKPAYQAYNKYIAEPQRQQVAELSKYKIGTPEYRKAQQNLSYNVGMSVVGGATTKIKPFSNAVINTVRKGFSPEVRKIVGQFAQLAETQPNSINRKNLGQLGDYIQSLGESVFGKKNVTGMTNKQLKNALDLAMQQAFGGEGAFPKQYSIGLSAQSVRGKIQLPKQLQPLAEKYGSISPTSGGKFVAYDPVRQERLYLPGKGTQIKYFNTKAEAQQALDKLQASRQSIQPLAEEARTLNQIFISDEIRQANLRASRRVTNTNLIKSSQEATNAWNKLREMGYKLKSSMQPELGFNLSTQSVRGNLISPKAKDRSTQQILKQIRSKMVAEQSGKSNIKSQARQTQLNINKSLQKQQVNISNLPSESIISQPLKERKFSVTARTSAKTAPETKANLTKSLYAPITNKATLAQADNIIKTNLDEAIRIAKEEPSTAVNNAVSMRLVETLQKQGKFNQATDILESLMKKPTSQGQAIQILSYWSKLTPTGALKYAQTLANRANQGKTGGFVKVSEIASKRITDLANQVQKLPEGREKILKTAELMDEIHSVVPPTLLSRISSIQTMAQLLNPKTAIRNIVGNLGFNIGENISGALAVPIDKATSLVTGKRSVAMPSVKTQVKSFGLGLKQGVEEALKGIDVLEGGGQMSLPKGQMWKGTILSPFEKALNIELKAPDKAFYKAAYDESLRNQMAASKVAKPTEEMIERAHYEGLYKTFQDENIVSKLFTGLKRALNLNKDFGLGDIILKYPKTPGNLIARGIDYSPAGFVKTIFQAAQPLFKKPFNQREFVQTFSRAITGTTGLITTGVLLHKLGIITGKPEKDKDISAVQRASGLGSYRINVSALKRLVFSGLDTSQAKSKEGDTLVSYDWFQPFAIALSMGANISDNGGEAVGAVATLLSSLEGGAETLAEQPLVTGLKRAVQGQSIVQSLKNTIKGIPSSFTPTALSQVNQVTDNTARETYDPNVISESFNMAKAKVPGLAQTLPERYDVFGQPSQRYQGGTNNFFNVFFNPAFVTKIKQTPEAKEVLDIFERSGEKQQAPRLVDRKIKVNGEDRQLTGNEISKYQQFVGQKAQERYSRLLQDTLFQSLPDEEKSKKMAAILTDVNKEAKIILFGEAPSKAYIIKSFITGENRNIAIGMQNAFNIEIKGKELKSAVKKQAVQAFFEGNQEEAGRIQQEFNLNLTLKDLQPEAKKRAIALFKAGNREEAAKLQKQFNLKITVKDLKGE